jgi:hypothetical protein
MASGRTTDNRISLQPTSLNSDQELSRSSQDPVPPDPRWQVQPEEVPVKILLFAFMFMFQGYGVMNGNPQHVLKEKLKEMHPQYKKDDDYDSNFAAATACFQLAKLLMRVCQIAFLVFLPPNGIVYVSYAFMALGISVPILFVWILGISDLWVVYLQYICGGIAIGLFEGTFLSCISGLGKSTKTVVIMGAPLGFAMHNIVIATLCTTFSLPTVFYYLWSLACIPVAIFIFYKYAPSQDAAGAGGGKGCGSFLNSMKKGAEWIPMMLPWFVAKFIGNFVLEDGFPLLFNVFVGFNRSVPMWSFDPATTDPSVTILFEHYTAWYWFVMMALGDTISRRVPHYIKLDSMTSVAFWISCAIAMCLGGESLCWLLIPIISGIAAFISNFGNGFIYGLSAKFIDAYIPVEHHYAAYNMWCFFGDCGGYAGQGPLSVKLADSACEGRNYTYMCYHPPPKVSTSTLLMSGFGQSPIQRIV